MVIQVKRRREWRKDKLMENYGRLMRKIMKGQVDGKRARGRPRKTWSDDF